MRNIKSSPMAILKRPPQAYANICPSREYPSIHGKVSFHSAPCGVLVHAVLCGLPKEQNGTLYPIFGFHIHEVNGCISACGEDLDKIGAHYNPCGNMHPYHAGDLPPLFGLNGYAFSVFLTNRICIEEIIGKAIIIHSHPDDFTSQPSGNPGEKIAYGKIVRHP